MTTIAPQGAPIPEQSGGTVIRIMRFMPLMIPMPVRVEPRVGSRSLLGPAPTRVWISGKIIAGGFGARLTCRQIARASNLPVSEATTEQIAFPSSRAVAIAPRSISRTAIDRSPGLWIQFIDGAGGSLTQRTYLGPCDRGPYQLKPTLLVDLCVDALIEGPRALDPDREPGLAITGEVCIRSGIVARLTESFGGVSGGEPGEPLAIADTTLVPDNTVIRFPRRPLPGPLGRDSWLIMTFLDGTGQPVASEALLGRARPGVRVSYEN